MTQHTRLVNCPGPGFISPGFVVDTQTTWDQCYRQLQKCTLQPTPVKNDNYPRNYVNYNNSILGYQLQLPHSTVRFGRVPKREKAKILAAMQKVNSSSQEKALSLELEDENKLLSVIVAAHEETCDYTRDKVAPLLERARTQPVYVQCPPQLVSTACPLNPAPHHVENGGGNRILEDFSERFSPAIRGVVEFAKRIPGFGLLAQEDQVTLLKAGVFEVLLVRLSCIFDSTSNCMICLNGQLLSREALHSASNARFLLDSMFDFAERLNSLCLMDSIMGLFCAVVLIAADRPGLRNTDLVQKIQKKLSDILQRAVAIQHPENPTIFSELMKKIPDLRTLNTLHSEKLLAYKMEPRNHQHTNGTSVLDSTVGNIPEGCYPSVTPSDQWTHYAAMMAAGMHHRPSLTEEDPRSISPSQQSSAASDWSVNDSKDGHDPFGSPRSVGSSAMSTDDVPAKSPMRVQSAPAPITADMIGGDVCPMNGFQHLRKKLQEGPMVVNQALNVGVLMMNGSNGVNGDHSSGDESYYVDSPAKGNNNTFNKLRRVDSPTDSGIESGKEHGAGTTPTTSVCSSPRSSLEEKVKDISDSEGSEKHETIDDMPVLKRALQAPPLINTNMLMDEAYRHHKKFRAAARKDADGPASPTQSNSVSNLNLSANKLSLASTHSTLVKTLEQAPRYMTEQQLKRTDLIHNIIMRAESSPNGHHQKTEEPAPSSLAIALQQPALPPPSSNHHPSTIVCSRSPQLQQGAPQTLAYLQSQQSKGGCPQGYYIPHSTPSNFGGSGNQMSWSFGSTATSSPNNHHHQRGSPSPTMNGMVQSQPKTSYTLSMAPPNNTPVAISAGQRVIYEPSRASPRTSSPSLVISSSGPGSVVTSPLHAQHPEVVSRLQSGIQASPISITSSTSSPDSPELIKHHPSILGKRLGADVQPLNLSTKAKMES